MVLTEGAWKLERGYHFQAGKTWRETWGWNKVLRIAMGRWEFPRVGAVKGERLESPLLQVL